MVRNKKKKLIFNKGGGGGEWVPSNIQERIKEFVQKIFNERGLFSAMLQIFLKKS